MRIALAIVLALASCGSKKSPCDTIEIRVDGAKVIELPTHAEYCLYTPDSAACCRAEGADCAALATAPHVFDIASIRRAPGCSAR